MMFKIAIALGMGVVSSACLEAPVQTEHREHQPIVRLATASHAIVRGEPFTQLGLLVDASTANFQYRVVGEANWHPVEVTWSEGVHHVGRVILDEPVTELELRNDTPWTFANVELYETVQATDVLARDLPVEEPSATSVNGIAPASLVISRADWGARNPNKVCGSVVTPYRMAIHHTASPDDDGGDAAARMRQMQAFHIDSNGWCDIGYHFVVSQGGQIFQARSDERRPGAHVGNANSGNVGISLIGNFQVQTPSETQLAATARIIQWVGNTYSIPFNRASIKGHREHSGQSTSCPGDKLLSRLDDLIARASGAAPIDGEWKADFQVRWLGETADFYQAGSSAGVPDFFAGDTLQAEIVLRNANSSPIRDVKLGYWFETPHLKATHYRIESDAPAFDGATFGLNDSNDNPDNPARTAMGEAGTLGLYAMAGGETKRIVVDLEVGSYSLGAADHPDLRAWMSHVEGLYGEQNAFDMEPTANNAFGQLVQAYAQLDVLSRNEWQFDAGEPEQVEGWTASTPLAVDVEKGALSAQLQSLDWLESPAWTSIDASAFDQLVLRAATTGAAHDTAIYWIREGEEFSDQRAVRFEFDPTRSTHVVPVGEHDDWSGEVVGLRIVPFVDGAGKVDLDAVFFQSAIGIVGSDRERLVDELPATVSMDGAPKPGSNAGEPGHGGLTDGTSVDHDDIRVNNGCATAQGGPGPWLLLGFLFFGARRRR